MNYPFECPNCGHSEKIEMRMSEYVASGHYCPECNTEMQREVKSLVCGASIDKSGDFYRKVN